MLAQLRAKGADVTEETQDMEGVGRFGPPDASSRSEVVTEHGDPPVADAEDLYQ